MDVLYIGGVYSEHLIPSISANCKSGYQFAAQAHEESIIKGLLENRVSLHVLSFPSVPTFPNNYRKLFIKSDYYYFSQQNIGKTIGRINLPILNYDFGVKKQIDSWFNKNSEKKYVLIYSLLSKFLKIAEYIKKTYPNAEIGVIVADLPEFMSWNKYYVRLGLKKKSINTIYQNIKYIDKFILLSKHMVEKIPVGDKPWIVSEGIYNPTDVDCCATTNKSDIKIILYTGNIDRRYGIMDVVYAFSQISNKDIELWICGFGDTEKEICEYEEKDARIKFFGSISRDLVLKFQKQASLLINPRHSNEEFTKYSFPSKTMEYLASGTPTLMCKLQCIPSDYEDYIFFIEDETIEGYKEAILSVLNKDKVFLDSFGNNAKRFIIETKNPLIQVNKILSFMK